MSRLSYINIVPDLESGDIVTLEEAKSYCRVDFDDDDELFERLIKSSRERIQDYTGRVLLPSTCQAIYEQEGLGDRILLVFSDNIVLDEESPYFDKLKGDAYIDTCDRMVDISYTAGYEAEDKPEWIATAALIDIAYRYENRGDVKVANGDNQELISFLKPFRKVSIF